MKKFVALSLITMFLMIPSLLHAQQSSDSKFMLFATAQAAQHHCPFDVVVWLNTKTDTYTLDPLKANDNNPDRAYMCQRDADQMDYHLAEKGQ